MFQKLVNHNNDLKRLVDKGYAVGFDSNYLIVRDIPYLDSNLELRIGAFVAKLVFVDENRVTQDDHQIYFAGSMPYNLNGKPIPNLGGGPKDIPLSENCKDVTVQLSFSNKPRTSGRFEDFFEKIESYVAIIAGPAMEKFDVNPYTFKTSEKISEDTVFKLHDTLTSRAEISDITRNFKNDIIAIIGLGGTGSYILDYLVKTPVKGIRIFDLDPYHVHNAFRSPGRLKNEELGNSKVHVFKSRYDEFRTGIKADAKFIDETCKKDFEDVTFAFVCVDSGKSRAGIVELLLSLKIPFVDVGMGLKRKNNAISGLIRTTYISPESERSEKVKEYLPLSVNNDDIYKTNIQIAELNALNASLAVIRYKQIRGFYKEFDVNSNLLFDISDLKAVGSEESGIADDKN